METRKKKKLEDSVPNRLAREKQRGQVPSISTSAEAKGRLSDMMECFQRRYRESTSAKSQHTERQGNKKIPVRLVFVDKKVTPMGQSVALLAGMSSRSLRAAQEQYGIAVLALRLNAMNRHSKNRRNRSLCGIRAQISGPNGTDAADQASLQKQSRRTASVQENGLHDTLYVHVACRKELNIYYTSVCNDCSFRSTCSFWATKDIPYNRMPAKDY